MSKIRLTREFSFEAAHALFNYNGKCSHLHGHSYKLFVTVKGEACKDKTSSNFGMVIDFQLLKKIVNSKIIDKFDHAVILSNFSNFDYSASNPLFSNVIKVDFQPTCENMLSFFAQEIEKELPKDVELFSLKLYETEKSFAEWYKEDNL